MNKVPFSMAFILISLSASAAPLEQTLEQGFLKCIGMGNIPIARDLMKIISDARVRSSFPRNHASTIDGSSFDTFQLNDVQAAGVLFRRPAGPLHSNSMPEANMPLKLTHQNNR